MCADLLGALFFLLQLFVQSQLTASLLRLACLLGAD